MRIGTLRQTTKTLLSLNRKILFRNNVVAASWAPTQAQDIEYICEAGPSQHGNIQQNNQDRHNNASRRSLPMHYITHTSLTEQIRSHASQNKRKGRIRIRPISSLHSPCFIRQYSSTQNERPALSASTTSKGLGMMERLEKEFSRIRMQYAPKENTAFIDELRYLNRLFIALDKVRPIKLQLNQLPRFEEISLAIARESMDFYERYKGSKIADKNEEIKFECLRVQAIAISESAEAAFDVLEGIFDKHSSMIDSMKSIMNSPPKRIDLTMKESINSVFLALNQILNACYTQDIGKVNDLSKRFLLNKNVLGLYANSSHLARGHLNALLHKIDSPLQFIQSLVFANTNDVTEMIAPIERLVLALSSGSRHREAFQVYMWANRAGIHHKSSISKRLMLKLSQANEQSLADDVEKIMQKELPFSDKASSKHSAQRLLAIRCAKRGDSQGLEDILVNLNNFAGRDQKDKEDFAFHLRLISASIRGEVEECVAMLESRYDMGEIVQDLLDKPLNAVDNADKPEAGPDQYRMLIKTLLNAEKVGKAEVMIDRMTERGIQVSKAIWLNLLRDYVRRNDYSSAIPLFDDLNKQGYPGDSAFLAMLSLFARKGDVENASQIVQLAVSQGFKNEIKLYNLLLHAHVQARSWQGANNLFEYLLKAPNSKIHPNQRTYTTMLRAHVAQRMPVQSTIAFLRNMMQAGFPPDAHSFTVLLTAAWDAKIVPIAEQLFTMTEKALGGKGNMPSGKGANAHHFTVMIRGYLAIHDGETAKEYFDELEERNLPIDGHLASVIVDGYAREEREREGSQEGQDSIGGLANAQEIANHFSRKLPSKYVTIHWPILSHAMEKGDSIKIQETIQGMIERSIEVPLEAWTFLMQALRRNEDIHNILKVWEIVFAKAIERERSIEILPFKKEQREMDNKQESVIRVKASMRHALCAPLSEIILALRDAKRPDEVAKIWKECRQHGFAFDSHNWNHLATTLFQSGRILDACEIIEQVINGDPPRYWSEELQLIAYERSLEDHRKNRQAKVDINAEDSPLPSSPSSAPQFEGQSEILFNEKEDIQKRSQSGQRIKRHLFRFPSDDPYVVVPGADESNGEEVDSELLVEEEQNTKLDINEMMAPLKAQKVLDQLRSPWFAHFETMVILKDIIDRGEDDGGVIRSQHNGQKGFITVRQLLKTHPRLNQLLMLFERTLENIRTRERRQRFKDRFKFRVQRHPMIDRSAAEVQSDPDDPNQSSLGYGVLGNRLEEGEQEDEFEEEEEEGEEFEDEVEQSGEEEDELEVEGDWRSNRRMM